MEKNTDYVHVQELVNTRSETPNHAAWTDGHTDNPKTWVVRTKKRGTGLWLVIYLKLYEKNKRINQK